MIRRLLVVLTLVLLAWAFLPFITEFETLSEVSPIARHYLNESPQEVGAGNTVTSVVVTYRGFDTLGEIVVLFAASCGVALLFTNKGEKILDDEKNNRCCKKSCEILQTASGFLMPLLVLFGAYIFIHGHLTPGGGFQGGVIIASGYLLLFLSDMGYHVRHGLLGSVESLSGAATFLLALFGLIMGAGFLFPGLLPIGKYGTLFSAGLVPVIYSLVGLKVGSELTGVLDNMRREVLPKGGEEC